MTQLEYGTRAYYEDAIRDAETKFELLVKGFASIVERDKYASYERLAEYLEQLNVTSNDIIYFKGKLQELEAQEAQE